MDVLTPDGAELCVESLGDEAAPPLLLIGGATCAMHYFDDRFCERFARGGLRVLRYDHRDTGESTQSPVGQPGYTGRDLADDAIAVLDGLGIDRAHLCGLSMGGGIAQTVGLAHADRVHSLTLMSTTFAADGPNDLPGPTMGDEPPEPDWDQRDSVIAYMVAAEQLVDGPDAFDEARTRAYAERTYDRTPDMRAALMNHWAAELGEAPAGTTADLARIPTLVVHGTADPMFGIEHGRALAAAFGAPLLELEGVGHQLPPPEHWDRVVDALLKLVSDP